jgi:hypothetical protein
MNFRRLMAFPEARDLPTRACTDAITAGIGGHRNGISVQVAQQQFGAADVSHGSFASIHDAPVYVRFTPDSDRIADIVGRPKCGMS